MSLISIQLGMPDHNEGAQNFIMMAACERTPDALRDNTEGLGWVNDLFEK